MPGANCEVFGCGSSRYRKRGQAEDISIFKLPNPNKNEIFYQWNKEILNIITRDRVVTSDFREIIQKNNIYIYARNILNLAIFTCVSKLM